MWQSLTFKQSLTDFTMQAFVLVNEQGDRLSEAGEKQLVNVLIDEHAAIPKSVRVYAWSAGEFDFENQIVLPANLLHIIKNCPETIPGCIASTFFIWFLIVKSI